MEQLEAKCSDLAVRSSLVANLSTVGGATLDKRIANTLKTLLNDSLAANLNFCGKGEKWAFKGTRLQLAVNGLLCNFPVTPVITLFDGIRVFTFRITEHSLLTF
ncbi:hypothetical protein CAPTEDRAFT_194985 [Capitella teleta]|uniref:Uncharacterized protein n=1 Tax=Capitella teleta TaxID=283909 RepID=R7VL00_CAPTE|nr:hypothetical protein CAPTEDRAFT_194985 [Capitella teleta]|eukprot:ELU17846.1 hypothetical protein CAPTEDRAFT_194985 [Capitella teleta]